jgi:signal transduction histidine kinase
MSQLLGVLKAGEEAPAFAPTPGVADIPALVAQAGEAGTRVSYAVEGTAQPLSAGISLALYRMAQEALTNVRKHAGPGATARITLRYDPDEALIRIADDGGDTPVPSKLPRFGAATSVMKNEAQGHGLAGMRDRVGLYGGTLAAGPCAGGGFEIVARLPVPAPVSITGPAA